MPRFVGHGYDSVVWVQTVVAGNIAFIRAFAEVGAGFLFRVGKHGEAFGVEVGGEVRVTFINDAFVFQLRVGVRVDPNGEGVRAFSDVCFVFWVGGEVCFERDLVHPGFGKRPAQVGVCIDRQCRHVRVPCTV